MQMRVALVLPGFPQPLVLRAVGIERRRVLYSFSPASEEESFATSGSSANTSVVLKIAEIAEALRFFRHHFPLSTGGVVESLPIPKHRTSIRPNFHPRWLNGEPSIFPLAALYQRQV